MMTELWWIWIQWTILKPLSHTYEATLLLLSFRCISLIYIYMYIVIVATLTAPLWSTCTTASSLKHNSIQYKCICECGNWNWYSGEYKMLKQYVQFTIANKPILCCVSNWKYFSFAMHRKITPDVSMKLFWLRLFPWINASSLNNFLKYISKLKLKFKCHHILCKYAFR